MTELKKEVEKSKTNKLKQEIEEYLAKDYCCEFKKECKDGVRVRCSEYEAKLYLILRFAEPREKRIEQLEEENRQLRNEVEDLTAYCNQIGKIKTGVLKLFEHVVAR